VAVCPFLLVTFCLLFACLWLSYWLTDWLSSSICLLFAGLWLSYWLTDWLTDWLTARTQTLYSLFLWLTDWLTEDRRNSLLPVFVTDWLTEQQDFGQAEESLAEAWRRITRAAKNRPFDFRRAEESLAENDYEEEYKKHKNKINTKEREREN